MITEKWLDTLIKSEIENAQFSKKYQQMAHADQYYDVKNDVLHRHRYVIGEHGEKKAVQNMADNRLAHGFFREIVDQKIAYLFGKPFTIMAPDQIRADMDAIFDRRFTKLLAQLAKDAILYGMGWLYVYVDEEQKVRLFRCNPRQIIPLWQDEAHTKLDAVIRKYQTETILDNGERKINQKIEYWHDDGVAFFDYRNATLFRTQNQAHLTYIDSENKHYPCNWQKLPFIPFRYNMTEQSLLSELKTLIDDYDQIASNQSNAIEDQPNSILVLRNYDGQDLGEFRQNLSQYRAVKVSDDGGVSTLSTSLDSSAIQSHLQRLRHDIYAFGRGVDIRSERFSKATSGIALKQAYTALDMDCNQLEMNFQFALRELLGFVRDYKQIQDVRYIGDVMNDVEFIFNRDIIYNELDAIDMCVKSKGIISDETIRANHPWTRSIESENKRSNADERKTENEKGELTNGKYGRTVDATTNGESDTQGSTSDTSVATKN